MRTRFVLVAVLVFVLFTGRRFLFPQTIPPPTPISSPPARGFLILFGIGGQAPVTWDGSVRVTGANILSLRPWRFAATDAITGDTWKLSTRMVNGPPGVTANVQENGVILKVSVSAT